MARIEPRLLLRILLGVLAVALLLALGRAVGGYVEPFRRWIEELGALAPVVFVLGYAAGVVGFVPGSALTLAAGALFGVPKGVVLVFVAAVLGSSAAFLIARYAARGFVERRIADNPQFAAIDRAIGREGRKIAFLLRLSPAIPFTLLNYALGLTRVRFPDYLLASLGMIPGTLLYVYLGSVAGDAASASAGGADLGRTLLNVVGVAATAAVTLYVTVLARRALREATAQGPE
jgi:uncharacterized membrane protein YdjX (TVP38/TMEM64 family)